jgi:hypothetical protein
MSIPPDPPPQATPAIRHVWRAVYERWGDRVDSWGVFACRFIHGTTTWSQHAWGNAVDWHASTELMDRIAAFCRSDEMRPYVSQVLWRVPDHYDHVHVSGRPLRTGTPPCATGAPGPPGAAAAAGQVSLPAPAATVAGESWEPAARRSARELVDAADRISRAAAAIRDTMGRR